MTDERCCVCVEADRVKSNVEPIQPSPDQDPGPLDIDAKRAPNELEGQNFSSGEGQNSNNSHRAATATYINPHLASHIPQVPRRS